MFPGVLYLCVFFLFAVHAKSNETIKRTLSDQRRQQMKSQLGRRAVYWVCSHNTKVQKIVCEDMGVHETEGAKADLSIEIITGRDRHAFGLRHAIPMAECSNLSRRIKKKLDHHREFCIRGDLTSIEASEIGWVFQEFCAGGESICETDECTP